MRERIVRELEAVRAAEEELQEKAVELERSNAELEQFAYVASHDLQEPLRKVDELLPDARAALPGQLDERGEQYIAFAVDGAKRMQALINDLLAFSRVGRIDRPPRAGRRRRARRGTRRATSSLAIEETGRRRSRCGATCPRSSASATLLGLVLQNLIANAIKFHGDEPPVVRVSARRDGERWEFAVADNGIGIDPEYAERIFVIFQRLHARDVYAGTGIGLAMCRKVVEYHGGRIWLDAGQNGGGSTFRFTLPVARHRHRGDHAMNQSLNVIEVLLVEDDPGDVVLIREAFEHNKVYNALHVVSDGVEALEFLRREGEHADARRPDLVLLDLNLPRKDGRRGARGGQGGRRPAHDPGRRAHDLRGRRGHRCAPTTCTPTPT